MNDERRGLRVPESPTDEIAIDELGEEFAHRLRAGDHPSIDEYVRRYPDQANAIREVFPTIQIMEDFKPQREDATPLLRGPLAISPPPERIGEFRIVREIGRGGMGVVYEAEQESLGRRVALKVLPAHLLANETLRSRFERESQAAARLHHTNIVPVFGVGEQAGLCYYVMQLIEGQSLDEAEPLDATAVARIGAQVAEALAYAHSQGIIHRDIKPSNLIVDDRGSVWVTDFGVAKLLEEANLTQSGDLVGTLRYMPPERFAGVSDAGGDVYGLGITLYELLAGRPAFPETSPHHLIQLITQTEPVALRKFSQVVPRDLETIVQKAAARDPARRYATATGLAEDLRRFLDDRPILARRITPFERAMRWARKNPVSFVSISSAFVLMIAISIVSVAASIRTSSAKRETEHANAEIAKALAAEQAQREHAETTSTLALEALNRVYDRFAPTRLVATPQPIGNDGTELPAQPVLPPEAIQLLEDLLRTYERIARASQAFPRLQAQAAEANHRIGDIHLRLGRFDDAIVAYRAAIDLYSQLPDEVTPDSRIKRARTYNELGRALRFLQRFDEAEQSHRHAIKTLTESPSGFAERPEFRFELARSYYTLVQRELFLSPGGFGPIGKGQGGPPNDRTFPKFNSKEGRPGEPHPIQRAVTILEQLERDYPTVPEYRHLLACCYRDAPPDRFGFGPPRAGGNVDRAVELMRKLIADHPRVPDYKLDLCETLRRTPPVWQAIPDEAKKIRERLEEAVNTAAELTSQYPNVPQYAAAHAQYLDRLGMDLMAMRIPADAEKANRKAVAIQSALVKQYPHVVAYRFWLSLMECSLARCLREPGQSSEARTRLESAIARLEMLRLEQPGLDSIRPFLGMAYGELAMLHTRSGEKELAAKVQKKAEEFGPMMGRPPGGFGPSPREKNDKRP
jgi:serine/threonine protein kinase